VAEPDPLRESERQVELLIEREVVDGPGPIDVFMTAAAADSR
jgi:hypothetical protein